MANMPIAEVHIDEALVTQLLRDQHPDLAHLPVDTLSNGWDNVVFRLGHDYVVRLPRREIAVQLIRNEQLFLPLIAELTSLRLPTPLRMGVPSSLFPWPWTIAPWFDGEATILSAPSEHTHLIGPLAEFLTALHRPAVINAPRNPVRGISLQRRDKAFRDRLGSAKFDRSAEISNLWEISLAIPEWDREPYWLHGDLHPGNILIHEAKLSAVIDFGDLCSGDPAADFAVAWMVFDGADRHEFQRLVTTSTGADAALWARARGWALNFGTLLLTNSDDNPPFKALGSHTIAAALDS